MRSHTAVPDPDCYVTEQSWQVPREQVGLQKVNLDIQIDGINKNLTHNFDTTYI
jgi:hypothetical protein